MGRSALRKQTITGASIGICIDGNHTARSLSFCLCDAVTKSNLSVYVVPPVTTDRLRLRLSTADDTPCRVPRRSCVFSGGIFERFDHQIVPRKHPRSPAGARQPYSRPREPAVCLLVPSRPMKCECLLLLLHLLLLLLF